MSSIVGPYAGVESDYRGSQIAASFRGGHRRSGRRLVIRKRRHTEPTPAVDWFGE